MNKKALSTMTAVFLVIAIGVVGYVISTSLGATGYAIKSANIDTSNMCRYGEKQCGFTNNADLKITCEMVGNENWPGINGDGYCVEQGYKFCSQGFFVVENKIGPSVYMPFSCGQVLIEEDLTGDVGEFTSKKFASYPNFEINDVITAYSCCNIN